MQQLSRGPSVTSWPPARTVMLDEVTAGAYAHLERRTALHDVHLGLGATFLWAGQWKRVDNPCSRSERMS